MAVSCQRYLPKSSTSPTKLAHLFLLVIFGIGVATTQGVFPSLAAQAATPAPDKPGELTPGEMQADFDWMRAMLEEVHPGVYRYSTKAEMDRMFRAQRAKLNHSMTEQEFMMVASETVANIRCGHTKVSLDDATQAVMEKARKLPLQALVQGRRLMVVTNDTPDDRTIRPGMEVVEINGHKVADIIRRLWPQISADGDIETGKAHDLGGGRFAQYYWILFGDADGFTIKARDIGGSRVTAKLAGVTDAERNTNRNPVNLALLENVGKLMNWSHDNQALRFLKDPDVAEIRIRYFIGNDYPAWVENTFKTLREKGTKSLIIDLRGNGGGDDMYSAMLVSYLTDKPFRFYDRIHVNTIDPSFKEQLEWSADFDRRLHEYTTPDPAGGYLLTAKMHSGLAEQSPGKYPFLGKVFILIDGGSFSGAADVCAVVHHLKRATFIGEETGGGYYGNNSGSMPTVTLPNSKLRIRLPLYEYWNAVPGYAGLRRGTLPDHEVPLRLSSVLRGVDEQLDLALKLAGN